MEQYQARSIFTAFVGLVNWGFGNFALPTLVLIGMSMLDYATGLAAAPYRNEEISSYKSIRGLFKKLGLFVVIVIALAIDWLIVYSGSQIGMTLELQYALTGVVAIWLISNEIISILENLNDIGVKLPSFILKIAQHIKSTSDSTIDTDN